MGIVGGAALLDLCYEEDSQAEVDMNVVMPADGGLVETQATAEKGSFSRAQLNGLIDLAEADSRRSSPRSGRCWGGSVCEQLIDSIFPARTAASIAIPTLLGAKEQPIGECRILR